MKSIVKDGLSVYRVDPETLLSDAISLLSQLRISELPVVDAYRRPLGMLDITDVASPGVRPVSSLRTMWVRIWRILRGWSMNTGQTS